MQKNYTLNSIILSGTNGVVFHPVGQRIGNSEVFNITEDNQNRIINDATESFAHAEGSNTLAGWRSHTEGHLTLANNTSHAEGRSTMALGKVSHAEGGEIYKTIEGLITVKPVSIYGDKENNKQTTIYVNKDPSEYFSVNALDANNIIALRPEGWEVTDSKRISEIKTIQKETEFECDREVELSKYVENMELTSGYGYIVLTEEDFPYTLPEDEGAIIYHTEIKEIRINGKTIVKVTEVSQDLENHYYGYRITFEDENLILSTEDTIELSLSEHTAETEYAIIIEGIFHALNYYPGLVNRDNKIVCLSDTIPAGTLVDKIYRTMALEVCSHAEGAGTQASGKYSHTEGYNTKASNDCTHAEGNKTVASGKYSHAEGSITTASGNYSHTEGYNCTAGGSTSHAEGSSSSANGEYSHAEGLYSIANGKSQHVQGRYNLAEEVSKPDVYGKYAHIVGNGTGKSNRSNCHTLDWDGNAWYQGTIESAGSGEDNPSGIILTSPNGTRYKFTVNDDGTLNTTGVKL